MLNYNTINPVNIHYRKYPNQGGISDNKKNSLNPDENNGGQRRFPNGNAVAIDYTKNTINISQVLQDFRSTIEAINSPNEVKEDVEVYLELVNKESTKNSPSKDIILSNLKNAARITDKYIQDSLKKPSSVVQDWVDALFLQNVNLKADPNEINEEFRVKIPNKEKSISNTNGAYTQIQTHKGGIAPLDRDITEFNKENTVQTTYLEEKEPLKEDVVQEGTPLKKSNENEESTQSAPISNELTLEEEKSDTSLKVQNFYAPKNETEALAKEKIVQGKISLNENKDVYSALKLYDEALELMAGSENTNLKSAVYFERAKIFDTFDYPELALIDYNKATKCEDNNLKTQAHLKMGNIYDDYVQFDPAMDQYTRAIETSEEINNYNGKTRALRYIAKMFCKLYDNENTDTFSTLALEAAKESMNPKTITNTYLEVAENYKYLGETSKALQVYGKLAQETSVQDDYEAMAKNYMEASVLMEKKGNKQKAYALMLKAKDFQRRAKLEKLNA